MAIVALAFLIVSCASGRSGDIAYAPSGFTRPDPIKQLEVSEDYRLGPSDLVNIMVYRAPDLTGDFRVDALGNVALPLIGQMRAQGYTPTEFSRNLERKLGEKYYENPDVQVALKEAAGQRVTIDGSVQAPGAYSLVGKTTLMQAIALARGTTKEADLRRVVVFRTIEGQRMAAAFDLKAIRNNEMQDPEVFGADIIIVDGNNNKQAWRDALSTIPLIALFRPFVL
ncbi:polysaccharide biosynthesis/export family protein [Sphingosinicella rhizophila]|uniref:Polysaccharide biosynthesis/export family protein n=1 Tax=Sphingosinicella rhizophila TaxID=3050082 RepID=A0ABU3Q673_9SPHN|nr:polysaccharide biosynthesis/export family protein [Sphingosinicella sp. GR2756]MDT9598904.1 polysaccharide biosynthesis/export family protein [Sphingosinicella sp. GR2756]